MIRGIILDVDGVIVGSKRGINNPMPHPDVIAALKHLRERGIPVSLCTGKGTFAIREIVEAAHLNNLHIGDGGAVVMDFFNNEVVEKHCVEKEAAKNILTILLSRGTYVEIYTVDGYHIAKNLVSDITTKHTEILGREPILTDSLFDIVATKDVVKIMPVAKNEKDKQDIIACLEKFGNSISLQWGLHPTALPFLFGLITAPGISKKSAAMTIAKHTGIPLEQTLGVGDGLTDWNFIRVCGFAGAMGNASEDLKKLVAARPEGTYYIGPGVDDNGVLDIFRKFKIF
ncbi:MAG: HAD family hydrolase [Candidatus Gottesmanbacteria bacterium]|nr:HAD family hydrolase [Candidatus Gottesmanbacteria bacterium]